MEKTRKGIELLFPELPVTFDPFGRIRHGFGDQATAINSPLFASSDELRPLEYAQMLRYCGEGDVIGRGQLAYRGLALRQAHQDAASGSIGKRGERGVEIGPGILNHLV
jgi:hypothetical protein